MHLPAKLFTFVFFITLIAACGGGGGESDENNNNNAPIGDTSSPTVPGSLTASNIDATEITLTWQPSTDNVETMGYRIYRDQVNIATVQSLTYIDSNLTPEQTYTYSLAAYDAQNNESAQSPSIDATTLAVSTEPSVVDAKLTASRTRGVSPLAVVFSAEKTTAIGLTEPQAFADIGYHFNFGDPNSGNHSTTGLSKNTQIGGPLATHVFECPTGQCVFTVGVRAQTAPGDYDDDFVTVTVDSASYHYAAADTVCVSLLGIWDGDQPCPAGAAQVSSLPEKDEYSNKRILLRRGETFGNLCIAYGAENVLIEPFGNDANARPVFPANARVDFGVNNACGSFNVTTAQAAALNAAGPWLENITIHTMRIARIQLGTSYEHVSVHNIDADFEDDLDNSGWISLASGTGRCYNSTTLDCAEVPFPKGAYVTDSIYVGSLAAATNGGVGVNIGAFNCPMINWLGVAGNSFRLAYEHNYRSQGQWRANFSHNRFLGHHKHTGGKNRLTLRGCGIQDIDPEENRRDAALGWININPNGFGPVSKYLVIADNVLGSTDSGTSDAYKGSTNPQNTGSAEGLQLGLWERNTFINSETDISNDLQLVGKDLTARTNNSYSQGASDCYSGFENYTFPAGFVNEPECEGPIPPTPLAPGS
jgi:Fibronectin type III domain